MPAKTAGKEQISCSEALDRCTMEKMTLREAKVEKERVREELEGVVERMKKMRERIGEGVEGDQGVDDSLGEGARDRGGVLRFSWDLRTRGRQGRGPKDIRMPEKENEELLFDPIR
ncbi:hypothetical protein KFK09_019590 [Dendrobium nobile]|uniref:Uncharacterized protein n=1 Tax=Dendrobium nobile TaxID=94219 RepID=A0A8T3ARF2_DENNO|nr:hypothetical protein KFK09_019590 [Dendrobium nobile]